MTYPFGFDDTCPNAHVRQQTGAALLLDCRAYELASAANAGGYDVESDLVAGQTPFDGYPLARGPVAGALRRSLRRHSGNRKSRPTTASTPTSRPAARRRLDDQYVGIPADNPFADGAVRLAARGSRSRPATHSPSADRKSARPASPTAAPGEPVRLPDGSLVQGMAGTLDPGPAAEPAGYVGRHLSADGSHFVFGSTSQFEPDGNSNGDVTIYDRDLETGVTQVVSKTPGGTTMTGAGIGELDISADGERVVFGQLVRTDSAGNRYWHLYMNVGGADQTIDLMPGHDERGALRRDDG